MSREPIRGRIARRQALRLLAAGAALGLPRGAISAGPVEAIDLALAGAFHALVAAQSPDGAWRSRTYGALKDGLSLTPPIVKALTFGPELEGVAKARQLGAEFLIRVRGEEGLLYPVYTAAMAVLALDRLPIEGARDARDGWARMLRGRQLTEELGWTRDDPAFGGWGYTAGPPRKDEPGGNLPDANLSSTLCSLGALRIVGVEADDPAIVAALIFVKRCQNFAETSESAFDDGGFIFSPCDPSRNKAGVAGIDRRDRVRYCSYGGPTADGLRALLRCGLDPDHPRVASARGWLERHFSATDNPGRFEPIREVERNASYYYYAWSVAHAFRALGLATLRDGRLPWAEELSRELIRRRRPDGTWANRFTATKEDDPLIATPLAAGALGACRLMLA